MSIPSLSPGGAEGQMVTLANGLSRRGHEVLIAVLSEGGPLAAKVKGAKLVLLGKHSRLDNARILLRLAKLYRSFQPHAHYSFLTTPNILGSLLRPLFPQVALLMGVRASAVDFSLYHYGRAGRLATRLEAWLSPLAQAVVANSRTGLAFCLERGYPNVKSVVIFNGIDTARFSPDSAARPIQRAAWGIQDDSLLVGLPARLDPIKDHPTFLHAAALLTAGLSSLRFVCIGSGPPEILTHLKRQASALGLAERLHFVGGVADMTAAYNALDLACLCSTSEGFPNVLGEAMACGVPCVTTDVGDAGLLVDNTGIVVPSGDPAALAGAIQAQLDRLSREGDSLRTACREHILANFSVERMVEATEELLLKLCAGQHP